VDENPKSKSTHCGIEALKANEAKNWVAFDNFTLSLWLEARSM
jgi:hypothetical protein